MKRKRLLWQLIPSYLAISLGALMLVGWLATITVHRFYLSQTEADLEVRARLIRQQLAERFSADNKSSLDSLSGVLGRASLSRITFINIDGEVLGDSDEDPAIMENHADRPEFKEALAGRTGVSIRFSTTLKKRMMYLAVPVKTDNGELTGVIRVSLPLATVKDELARVYSGIVLGGLLAIVFAALLSYIVSRRISDPLVAMKQGAQRFAAGELRHRLSAPRVEELSDLATALNKMAVDLDDQIETITSQRNELEAVLSSMVEGVFAVDMDEKFLKMNRSAQELLGIDAARWQGRTLTETVRNPDVQHFVSDFLDNRHPMEREITVGGDKFLRIHGTSLYDAANREIGALIVMNDITRLRKLETIQRDFAANVSHELRTPITSIKGFVETLQEGAINDPQSAARFLDIIVKHTDRLNAIIEDLLSLARIEQDVESNRIALQSRSVREVVTAAINLCESKASEKGISIEIHCPEDYVIDLAANLLERATVNLLDNAVNFSDPDSSVQVEISKQGSYVIISIRDSGCGIASDHLPRLFERFYRVDPDRSRKHGGTGLGLAIVKHIALAHNGRVSVDSKPGQGSTFRIHLPV